MPVPVMKGFLNLERVPEEKVTDQITRRIVTGEKEMLVFWKMKAGAHAAAHKHPNEQIFWMLDIFSPPREDFYTGQDTYLRKG